MENLSQNSGRRKYTLADQAGEFIDDLRQRKLSVRTVGNRHGALKRFLNYMDANAIDRFQDVTVAVLEDYRLMLLEAHLTDQTIENYLQAVRHLFDFMETRSLLFENPARCLQLHRKSQKVPEALTEAEVSRLLAMPDCSIPRGLRDRALMETLYSCGMRRQELLTLTVFDINFDQQTVRLLGKGRKERLVPVGKHGCRYLKRYIKDARPQLIDTQSADTDALWWGIYHRPLAPQSPHKIVSGYAKKAGIKQPVSTHTLRRTCATHMLAHGAHPLMIAELLGHSDLKVLSRYLKVTIADLFKTHGKTKPGR